MEIKFKKMLDEIEDKDCVLSFNDASMKVIQVFSIITKIIQHKLFKNALHEITSLYHISYDISTWMNGLPCELLEPKKG